MNYILNQESITLMTNEGVPLIATKGHPSFQKVRKAILNEDFETALDLLQPRSQIEKCSENITIQENEVFYKNYPINLTVTATLLGMIREGAKNLDPWLKHVELLMENPNSKSREELYDFLSYKGLPIDEDGYVLAYRGVNNELWSKSGNLNTIVLQGRVNDRGQIWNGVGETIEVDRGSVDGDRSRGCSHGLHVGSFDYATSWAGENGRIILIRFSPADAVSVPSDCNFQKLRVCKYEVVKEITESPKELKRACYKGLEDVELSHDIEESIEDFFNEYDYNVEDFSGDWDLADEMAYYGEYNIEWSSEDFRTAWKSFAIAPKAEEPLFPTSEKEEKVVRSLKKYKYQARDASTSSIQKNLGIKGLTCAEIAEIAESIGMFVLKLGPVSKWIVS